MERCIYRERCIHACVYIAYLYVYIYLPIRFKSCYIRICIYTYTHMTYYMCICIYVCSSPLPTCMHTRVVFYLSLCFDLILFLQTLLPVASYFVNIYVCPLYVYIYICQDVCGVIHMCIHVYICKLV